LEVGDGESVRFWEDAWASNTNLKTLFPRLYSLSMGKGKAVGEVGFWVVSGWQWRLNWRRDRFEWELGLEEELMEHIYKGVMNKESKDHIVWGWDITGVFSVKSAYARLVNQTIVPKDGVFSSLWKAKALPKALITGWRVLLDRIPISVNLHRRGVAVNTTLCALCGETEESSQHLFLNCNIA